MTVLFKKDGTKKIEANVEQRKLFFDDGKEGISAEEMVVQIFAL